MSRRAEWWGPVAVELAPDQNDDDLDNHDDDYNDDYLDYDNEDGYDNDDDYDNDDEAMIMILAVVMMMMDDGDDSDDSYNDDQYTNWWKLAIPWIWDIWAKTSAVLLGRPVLEISHGHAKSLSFGDMAGALFFIRRFSLFHLHNFSHHIILVG